MTRRGILHQRQSERGNVFAMLFAAVALTGVLAAVGMQTLTGPVTTITRVTQRNVADNNLLMDAKIIVNAAVTGVAGGDPDSDGIIEPAAFVPAGGGETPPGNGGFLPTDLGLSLTDPWGTKYGYCVWDHGTTNSSANRLTGDNTASAATQAVIALVAAGPDKAFETTCSAYSGGAVQVTKAGGSDDIIFKYTYAEATASSNGLWTINTSDQAKAELKDASGSAVNVSINRDTGIGDFLGLTTSVISAKTGETIALDGGLLLDMAGASADTCTAAEKGALRLNSTMDDLELCDGASGWAQVKTPPGGSAGHVQFNDGAGGFGGDANLFWDNTNKRLGIGTATPGQALDVSGNFALSGSGTMGGTLDVTGATTLSSTLNVTGNATVDTGTLFVDATNNAVGIGTTTPSTKFNITDANGVMFYDGSSAASNNLVLNNLTPTNGRQFSLRNIVSGGLGRFDIRDDTSGLEHLSITATGNVGIGTTSPNHKLDVAGSINAGGSGDFVLSRTDMREASIVRGNYAAGTADRIAVQRASGGLIDRFSVYADTTHFNGNVGIGTTLPTARLDVAGGVKIGTDAVCNAAKAGMAAWNSNQLQICDGTTFKNISAIDKLDDIGDVDVPTPNNNDVVAWNSTDNKWEAKNIALLGPASVNVAGNDGDIQFKDGSDLGADPALHWDNVNKRLGIGAVNPSNQLEVYKSGGTGLFSLHGSGDGWWHQYLRLDNNDATKSWILSQAQTGNFFALRYWNGATYNDSILTATTGGNVGIGTTSPTSLLHVAGGIQLGDDTSTCPGASNVKLGTMRFNSGALQVCKAAGWGAVSSGGAGSAGIWSAVSTSGLYLNTTSPAMTDIPGMSVTFTLPQSTTVLLLAEGGIRTEGSTYAQSGFAFVVNGTLQGDASWGDAIQGLSGNPEHHAVWVISRVATLPAGSNTIKVQAYPYGDLRVCSEAGGTVTNYKKCRLTVVAVGSGGGDTLAGLSCASGEIPKWNGTAWACAADGGGSSGGSTMVSGWPDAIKCTGSGGSAVLNLGWQNAAVTSTVYALSTDYGSVGTNSPRLTFSSPTAAGSLDETASWANWLTDCSGKTIAQLYASGQAFNFVGGGSGGHAVSFYANRSGAGIQTVTSSVIAKVLFTNDSGGEAFDPDNTFDTTASRFTPTVAGKYLVIGSVNCLGNTGLCINYIYKNGGMIANTYANSTSNQTYPVVTIVNMNGTTDYLEVHTLNQGGTQLDGSIQNTYFTATLLTGGGSGTPGGSDTQVQFNDNGVLGGAAQLFWDKANNRLGVNVAAPTKEIDVAGTVTSDRMIFKTVAGAAAPVSGSTYWSSNGTDVWRAVGNVGIGTTSPAVSRLHVVTSGNLGTLNLSGGNLDPAASPALASMVNGSLVIGTNRSGGAVEQDFIAGRTSGFASGFSFYDNNLSSSTITPLMRIEGSTGNVGIGTANPSSKLTVVGGKIYLAPSSGSPDQGLQVDTTNQANGSNAIIVTNPAGWTGNIIKSNLNGVEKFSINQAGAANFTGGVTSGGSAGTAFLVTQAANQHGVISTASTSGYYAIYNQALGAGSYSAGFYTQANNSTGCTLGYGTTAWSCFSDSRLKKNVETIPDALGKLALLRGVTFNTLGEKKSDKKHLGVIAQEVLKAFPEAVSEVKAPGAAESYYSVEYTALIGPIISGINQLKELLDDLAAKVAELVARVSSQDKAIKALQADNDALKAELEARRKADDELQRLNASVLKRLDALEAHAMH